MNLREYENLYVFSDSVNEEKINEIIFSIKSKVLSSGGKNIQVIFLGKKKMFFSKNGFSTGVYYKHKYIYMANKVSEMENFIKFKHEIILKQILLIKDNVKLELIRELDDVLNIELPENRV